jgi:hypothetical protein
METYELASSVILVSVSIGLIASAGIANGETESSSDGHQGEVHEHALFHVVINGSEVDFTERKYQLNAGDVHLENNKSDIVHKHESGVTWSRFLNTINTTYWRSNSTGNLCLSMYDTETCGDGAVYLNGEEVEDLDAEFRQDDHLLIVLDTENRTAVMQEYMKQQLPQEYKPQSQRGRRV